MPAVDALPALAEQHGREVPVAGEAPEQRLADIGRERVRLVERQRQAERAARIVGGLAVGRDRPLVVAEAVQLLADQVADALVIVRVAAQQLLVDGQGLSVVASATVEDREVALAAQVRPVLDVPPGDAAPLADKLPCTALDRGAEVALGLGEPAAVAR